MRVPTVTVGAAPAQLAAAAAAPATPRPTRLSARGDGPA